MELFLIVVPIIIIMPTLIGWVHSKIDKRALHKWAYDFVPWNEKK